MEAKEMKIKQDYSENTIDGCENVVLGEGNTVDASISNDIYMITINIIVQEKGKANEHE